FVGAMFGTIASHVPPPAGLASPTQWGSEEHLAELFGPEVAWTHNRRTFTFRFTSPEAFVEAFAEYYGPTVKALEAAGSARATLAGELRDLARSWNRLEQPGSIAVPAVYLESVGLRR